MCYQSGATSIKTVMQHRNVEVEFTVVHGKAAMVGMYLAQNEEEALSSECSVYSDILRL